MNTAVIISGSSQYLVSVGKIIEIQKISAEVGEIKEFSNLLNKNLVQGEIIAQIKAPKVRVFKYKNKTGYHKTQGHRQKLTKVKIISIGSEKIEASQKVEKKVVASQKKPSNITQKKSSPKAAKVLKSKPVKKS